MIMHPLLNKLIILIILLSIHFEYKAQNGRLITKSIDAPSIGNNILGIPTSKTLAIYLPPSYDSTNLRYPVVYFLPGYTDQVHYWTNDYKRAMDKLINGEIIKEFIVVVVDGYNFMGGSFYVNSPVTGNYEDFIIKDVVGYIDENYRTINDPKARGISGHSMGGFGALNLAMLHPDIFGSVYSLSPGLFDKNGLSNCQLFKSQSFINQFIQKEQEYLNMPAVDALTAFKSYIQSRFNAGDADTPFGYAYGAAFSPNPGKLLPFIDYPFSKEGDQIVVDSAKLQNYENGFGDLENKVDQYKENFLKLKLIGIDYGLNDEYRWIPQGCEYFSNLLTSAGIPHYVATFNGGHGEQVVKRVEEYMLPSFSNSLDSDSALTGLSINTTTPKGFSLYQNYPNPANPSTVISYQLAVGSQVTLKIYDVLGNEVATLINEEKPAGKYEVEFSADGGSNSGGNSMHLSSGIYFYRLSVESYERASNFVDVKKMIFLK